ncbi:hypothetical protein Hanom_Chr05g00401291 [Helianthus anomalus]
MKNYEQGATNCVRVEGLLEQRDGIEIVGLDKTATQLGNLLSFYYVRIALSVGSSIKDAI